MIIFNITLELEKTMADVPQDVLNQQLGTFWRGADNNVYVAGSDGTNSAGSWTPQTSDYWSKMGYKQTADPVTPVFPGTAPTVADGWTPSGSTLSSSSSGSGRTSYDPNDLAYLDQQISRYQGLLNNVDTYQNQGLNKLNDSYNSATNKANLNRGRALTDFGQQRYDSINEKNKAINTVDTNSRTLNESLRRILGMAGGTGSSAYKYAAPNAIAKLASGERGNVLSNYSANENSLKTAEQRAKEDYDNYLQELLRDKISTEGELRSGFDTQRQSINDMLAQLAAERAGILGGNQLAATAPYTGEFDRLQSNITGYGDRYRTAVNQRDVKVNPVSLRDYVVDRQGINANKAYGQSNYSPYAQFLKRQQEEERTA